MYSLIAFFFIIYNIGPPSRALNCSCHSQTSAYNFTCLKQCHKMFISYSNSCNENAARSCSKFLDNFLPLTQNYSIATETLLTIYVAKSPYQNSTIEIDPNQRRKLSFDGQSDFACEISLAELRHQEMDLLSKCFHFSSTCINMFSSKPGHWSAQSMEQYKQCLLSGTPFKTIGSISARTQLQSLISQPIATRAVCALNETLIKFELITFPIETKAVHFDYSTKIQYSGSGVYPSNDIKLQMTTAKLTPSIYIAQLNWDCPTAWNGLPDMYKLTCVTFSSTIKDTIADCQKCWQVSANYYHSNNSHVADCKHCWAYTSGEKEYPVGNSYEDTSKIYRLINIPNAVLSFVVGWSHHNASFIVNDCEKNCTNSENLHLPAENIVWQIQDAHQAGIYCSIKAKNRQKAEFGWASEHVAVKRLDAMNLDHDYLKASYSAQGISNKCRDETKMINLMETDGGLLQTSSYVHHGASSKGFQINNNDLDPLFYDRPGCFDWISQRWYFPMVTPKHLTDADSKMLMGLSKLKGDISGSVAVIPADHKVHQVSCLPSKSLVVWTSTNGSETLLICFAFVSVKDTALTYAKQCVTEISKASLLHSDCAECSRIGQLNSLAFDSIDTFGNASLILATNTGIWTFFLEECRCYRLVENSVLRQQLVGVERIKSFTLFSSDTVYFSTDFDTLVRLKLPRTWQVITGYYVLDFPVSLDMLEHLPGFPSHWLRFVDFNDIEETCMIPPYLSSLDTISSGFQGKIPDQCLIPNLHCSVEMTGYTVANVTVYASFDTSRCNGYSKPPVSIYLRYGPFTDELHLNLSAHCVLGDCPCDNSSFISCMSAIIEPTRLKTNIKTIVSLLPEQNYVLELFAAPKPLIFPGYEFVKGAMQWHEIGVVQIFRSTYTPEKYMSALGIVVCITLAVLLIVVIIMLAYAYKKRWYMYRNLTRIKPEDVTRKTKLGKGHFGDVWEAELNVNNKKTPVAIKQLNEAAGEKEKRQFLEEAIILSKLDHPNIVKPLGICMSTKPVMLALEFLNGGSLQTYLRRNDVRNLLQWYDLRLIAIELCKACVYLQAKNFIHRDISAKNCLISLLRDSLKPSVIKLTDFGLAKDTADVYNAGKDAVLPVPYTAPEGLNQGAFTSKSDVWSFGVLLWEIFSWAANPFGACYVTEEAGEDDHCCPLRYLSMTEIQFLVCVDKKTLNDLPPPCCAVFTPSLRKLMDQCWCYDPGERPNFSQMEKFLHALHQNKTNLSHPFEYKNHLDHKSEFVHLLKNRKQSISTAIPAYSSIETPSSNRKDSIATAIPAYSSIESPNCNRKDSIATAIPAYSTPSSNGNLEQTNCEAVEPSETDRTLIRGLIPAYSRCGDDVEFVSPKARKSVHFVNSYDENTDENRDKANHPSNSAIENPAET